MEKMLVVLQTRLLKLEIRLKNLFENCQKVIKENEPNFCLVGSVVGTILPLDFWAARID